MSMSKEIVLQWVFAFVVQKAHIAFSKDHWIARLIGVRDNVDHFLISYQTETGSEFDLYIEEPESPDSYHGIKLISEETYLWWKNFNECQLK